MWHTKYIFNIYCERCVLLIDNYDESMDESYMWCIFIKELYVDAVYPLCHLFFFYKDGCFGKGPVVSSFWSSLIYF